MARMGKTQVQTLGRHLEMLVPDGVLGVKL